MSVRLVGGRIIDPANDRDEIGDLFLAGGRMVDGTSDADWTDVDCRGLVVAPGFIDLYNGLADGRQDAAAASAGGFTTVVASAEHPRVLDDPTYVHNIARATQDQEVCRVLFAGALTRGLEGMAISEMGRLVDAGCVVLSHGSRSVPDSGVLRSVLEYASRFDVPVMMRPVDAALEGAGVVGEGDHSFCLGLPSVAPEAEEIGIYRLAALARRTGCSIHLSHIWSAVGVEALRIVRSRGDRVTASTAVHNLALDASWITRTHYNGRCRFSPPLAGPEDRLAVAAGLEDGTIDAVASDHRPLAAHCQDTELQRAEVGAVGSEFCLSLVLGALEDVALTVRVLTEGPAKVLRRPSPTLGVGMVADVVVFDPTREWTVERAGIAASRCNTPLLGEMITGRVRHTFLEGKPVFRDVLG